MTLRTAGGKTSTESRRRSCNEDGAVCHAHNAAAGVTPLLMRPRNMGTLFVSKTLFQIPATGEAVMARRQCQLGPPLFTFPMDGRHLFVACGSEGRQRDEGSTVYVVRLCPGGAPTSLPSRLPIADISGCVQNYSVHPPPWSEQAAGEAGGGSLQLPAAAAEGSVRRGPPPARPVSHAPGQRYPFLLADAATHAIWAVEVDTATLAVCLVTQTQYRGCNGGDGDVATADDVNPQQQLLPSPQEQPQQQESGRASRPTALLGGIEGFVDGTFHSARFASPAALCWRVDDEAAAADASGEPRQPHPRRGTPHCGVLFVSDRGNHAVRHVDFRSEMVRTILGMDGVPGYRDGEYCVSRLQEAASLVWCTSGLLFLDKPNGALRLITGLKEKRKMTAAAREEAAGSPQRVAQLEIPGAASEEATTHATCRVWTVAGGLHGKMGQYFDAKEPQRVSLGTPSTLALAPDGRGVLVADSQHGALHLVSSRGVETFLGLHSFPNAASFPAGLMACSHLLLCRLTTSNGVARDAFLVSSGVQGTVSLLVPDGRAEAAGDGARVDLEAAAITSLAAEECGVVASAGLPRRDACLHGNSDAVARGRKQTHGGGHRFHRTDSLRETASPFLAGRSGVSTRVHFLPTSASGGPLGAATRRLFEVYAYYASRSPAPPTMTDVCRLEPLRRREHLGASCSLSLMRFWRFLTHAEYFGRDSPRTPPLAASCACVPPAALGLGGSENAAAGVTCWRDWRCAAEVLHGLSVRHHGYRVLSVMDFAQFCRVILALHCWLRRQCETRRTEEEEEERELRSRVDRATHVSIEELSGAEVVEAYADAVRQVRRVNVHLRRAADDARNDEAGGDGGAFLAADDVLRVLVRNEKPLRQLFDAYSERPGLSRRPASATAESEEAHNNLRWIHALLLSTDAGEHAGTDAVAVVSYGMFHKLLHALDVFPCLLSEALLRRAYVDALLTPLFQTLRRGAFAVEPRAKEQQRVLPFALEMSQDVEKWYTRCGAGLAFLPFVEAFTRVALTAFSLCPEHDRWMYPTAAAKVEALMRWVNRSVEQFHQRGRGDAAAHDAAARGECVGGRRALLPPVSLCFDVPARVAGPHRG
ncbi:uncharacterized protein Tco025E_06232 [Trypanosoma conorhini]|uniref:Uncharacterized protein n=1 Tax=Trypanosoma conorhini TaxID=83891 RepID=A0A422P6P4_9TRYP|nr:uncharacterized protein Tco025E_06232 [Trypanosoma conorhini]RNF13380.1 hypothetical protein Tco025E_06232 [Trypanosoma conorhini]